MVFLEVVRYGLVGYFFFISKRRTVHSRGEGIRNEGLNLALINIDASSPNPNFKKYRYYVTKSLCR